MPLVPPCSHQRSNAEPCYGEPMQPLAIHRHEVSRSDQTFMLRLREALEASWDVQTAYGAVEQVGNPALGQCYPTSRVVQHYYPATEIIKGKVWTGESEETHFWNGLPVGDEWYHIDLSWRQYPVGSVVREFLVLDRQDLADSEATIHRCSQLLERVESYLRNLSQPFPVNPEPQDC